MRAWIENVTGDYFETDNNLTYSRSIATETKPRPSNEAEDEIAIQKEISRLTREQAIKQLQP